MPRHHDPEGHELAHARRLARFEGANVVEIGCGDGRLTAGYAHVAARVIALDPDAGAIAAARANAACAAAPNVTFQTADGRATGLPPNSADIVFCSRSL